MTKKKDFDCVEMMHEGGLRIHEALKGKTREEKVAYWRERDEAVRRDHPRLREPDGGVRSHPKRKKASEVAGMLKSRTNLRSPLEEMDEAVAEAFRKGDL